MTHDDLHRNNGLRVPPHSFEAEEAVLGGLMLVARAWFDVCDLLTEEDFYHRRHALIWRAVRWLQERGKPYDAVTLAGWFETQGLAEHVGGDSTWSTW